MSQTDNSFTDKVDSRRVNAGGHFFLPLVFGVFVVAYLALHLWSLPWFPFVHSDEAWLASLSRSIWNSGPGATEEFFVLTPRHPHALKTLYHIIQAPFVMLSWSAAAARIPSLLAGIGTVVLVAMLLKSLTGSALIAFFMTAAFALDVQFFYISHLARQEALVLAVTMGAVLILVRGRGTIASAAAASLIGITIFIHPNAFIAACAAFPWLFRSPSFAHAPAGNAPAGQKKRSVAVYAGVLLFWALAALAVSIYLDPQFISHYRSFGDTVGVSTGLFERFLRFREFFVKMASGHAGTYYLAPIAPQLWALPLVSFLALVSARRPTAALAGLGSLGMTLLAIFIIGKNSPPGLVFLFPWLYIITGVLLDRIVRGKLRPFLLLILILIPLATGFQLARALSAWYPGSYNTYLTQIRTSVPEGERVLANLNTAFAFPPGKLRVWRDLGSLPPVPELPPDPSDHELLSRPTASFLKNEKVEWIAIPREELEKIYRERPVWNEVYGNPHRFYPDLLLLLERFGTRVAHFEAGPYAMRLVSYMDRGPYHLEIYRIKLP